MKRLSLLFSIIIVLAFNYCNLKENSGGERKPLTYVKYISKIEFISTIDNKKIALEDSLLLVYGADSFVMRIPIPSYNLVKSKGEENAYILEDSIPLSIKYNYACFTKKDSLSVYYLSDELSEPGTAINADSLLNKHITLFPFLVNQNTDSLLNVKEDNSTRIETYFAKYKPDESYSDSVILSFTKGWPDFPFRFSKGPEKNPGMKLNKILLKYNSSIDPVSKKRIPEREIKMEIQIVNPIEDKFIDRYFQK